MEAVATCANCGHWVSPEAVQKVQRVEEKAIRFLIFECPKCGTAAERVMGEDEYKRFAARWKNYKRQGKTKVTKTYDPEYVGIMVAGFRKVDLPTIETVDDLIVEWRATTPPMEKSVRLKGSG